MPDILRKLGLKFNPFEPSASGPPVGIALQPPTTLADPMRHLLDRHQTAAGPTVVVIVGEYGTGKTCLLRWLHERILPQRRIKSFYFDNPGVYFYDLANRLLRTIGRKNFAKFIWELASPHVSTPYQRSLFQDNFEAFLVAESKPRQQRRAVLAPLQTAIIEAGITTDEEIAHCLGRIVADAVTTPYFQYRDFLPRHNGSVVAENEEAPYFGAVLRTLKKGFGVDAVAFLIDEFEEIGLQKRLTKRAAHDYLATLKRLINLAHEEDNHFWLFLSMTPDVFDTTRELEEALIERVSKDSILHVGTLQPSDAVALMQARLDAARPERSIQSKGSLFPFQDPLPFGPKTRANPRRLVQACSAAIAGADDGTALPFTGDYLQGVEMQRFPMAASG